MKKHLSVITSILILTILLIFMSLVAKGDTVYTVTMTAPGGG